MWRKEDEDLLARLENEELLAGLVRHHAGAAAVRIRVHPRAAGLVESARALPGGEEASREIAAFVRFLEAPPMSTKPPELLHHLALYFDTIGRALAVLAPDAASNAWMRSLAAWIALSAHPSYLKDLSKGILGADAKKDIAIDPTTEMLEGLTQRAVAGARDLTAEGRASLNVLAWAHESLRIAGVNEAPAVTRAAERGRNAALDTVLGTIAENLEEANMRGELAKAGPAIVGRVIAVWEWSGYDSHVEHFAVERVAPIAWEMYRARQWDNLRRLIDPFWPLTESLAARIKRDPSEIAYAAPCAQMYVFFSDVERADARKMELAEKYLVICPTHRNGRLTVASLLCHRAQGIMAMPSVFGKAEQIQTVEALVARAEKLYPQTGELPKTKQSLETFKKMWR